MIHTRIDLRLQSNLWEPPLPGLETFNLIANHSDIASHLNGRIPLHWHDRIEFFLMVRGETDVEAAGETIHLKEGEGCFINSGVLHGFQSQGQAVYHSFVLDAGILSGAPGSVFDVRYVRPFLKEGPALLKVPRGQPLYSEPFERAFHACETEGDGYEWTVRSALSDVFLYLRRLAAEQNISPLSGRLAPADDQRIKLCLQWIDAHLDKPVTVSDIASAASISPRECQRLFQKCLHRRPIEYLLYRRLLRAAQLLSEEKYTVTEAALYCGFESPSYFSKKFRELTGFSPSSYQKNHS